MEEDKPQPAAAPASNEGQPQTVEIPLSAMPQAKEGDSISLQVVSVDADNGVNNAVPATAAPDEGGSDSMAKEFDQPIK